MLNKKPSRPSLALFVALALGSSAFLAPSSPVAAADVTIDNGHAPSGNAPDPNTGTGSFGSAAGVINDPANSDDVSGNTMTLDDYDYSSKNIFGGFTRGTGRAIGNTIHIRNGGDAASAYGGFT